MWKESIIATLPTGYNSLRLVDVSPTNTPFFLGERDGLQHPLFGNDVFPALKHVAYAALSPEGLPTCAGPDETDKHLTIVQRGEDRRTLHYQIGDSSYRENGLVFWQDKELFVTDGGRSLVHGEAVIDQGEQFSPIRIGPQGPQYAVVRRGDIGNSLISGSNEQYLPRGGILSETQFIQEHIYREGEDGGDYWICFLCAVSLRDSTLCFQVWPNGNNELLGGGYGIDLVYLSINAQDKLHWLEIDRRNKEREYTIVIEMETRIPVRRKHGGYVRQLSFAGDKPVLRMSTEAGAYVQCQDDNQSDLYAEILAGSLTTTDTSVSFIAIKGDKVVRVNRTF